MATIAKRHKHDMTGLNVIMEEYADCMTLARQYDVSRDEIKRVVRDLRERGYHIETLFWGKQNKLKVHAQQFRAAIMHEFRGC